MIQEQRGSSGWQPAIGPSLPEEDLCETDLFLRERRDSEIKLAQRVLSRLFNEKSGKEVLIGLKAIVCADQNWGIGNQGHLLVNIPSDMKFFRDTTIGHVVVMGRRTFDGLPGRRPLEDRVNIVLSRDANFHPAGVIVVRGKKELFEELKKYDADEIFIIGGTSVYELMLPYCDEVLVTKVDFAYQADCYFPNLDYMPEWELAEESEEQTCFDIEFVFRKYRRKYHTAFPEI